MAPALGSGQQKIGSGFTLKVAAPGGSATLLLTLFGSPYQDSTSSHQVQRLSPGNLVELVICHLQHDHQHHQHQHPHHQQEEED